MISLIISYISLNASSITYILSNLTQIQCVTSVHGCSITVKESMTCLGRKRHVTSLRSHVAKRYFPVRECDTLRTHETRAQSYDAWICGCAPTCRHARTHARTHTVHTGRKNCPQRLASFPTFTLQIRESHSEPRIHPSTWAPCRIHDGCHGAHIATGLHM